MRKPKIHLFEVTISTYAAEKTTRVCAIDLKTAIGKAVLMNQPPEVLKITANKVKGT